MPEDTVFQLKKLLTEMMDLLEVPVSESVPVPEIVPVSVKVNSQDLFKFDSNFEQLIKNGADVNIQDEEGLTPLFYTKIIEQMKLLLEAGANINHQNHYSNTPLHHAETIEQIKLLIEKGANPNIQNETGSTRLFYCYCNTPEMVKEILKAPNLDLTLKNKQGLTAKEYLQKEGMNDHVRLIEEYEKIKKEEDLIKQINLIFQSQNQDQLKEKVIKLILNKEI